MRLRDLDERLLPSLARWVDRVVPKPPPPTGPLPVILRLRQVDDRWTTGGALALLRDVPQLGAVAIAAIVLAGGITVASRTHPTTRGTDATEQTDGTEPPDSGLLGPQLGDSVPAYVDAARQRLARAANAQPDGAAVAVVSFSGYRTVLQAQEIVGPSRIVRVYYRVPLPIPQTDARSVAVGDLVPDVRKEWGRVADFQEREANELLKVAKTIENDPAQKKQNEADAAIYAREAQQLRGDCACVYAVVVESRLRILADLLAQPAVRVVDAGRPKARIDDYEFSALLPEEKVTVTGGDQAG